MSETIAKLSVDIGARLKGFDDAISTLEGKLGKLAGRLSKAGSSLTSSVTLPLAVAGGAAVKFAADFDKAMAQSTSIMGTAGQQLRGELEATARAVARDSVQSASEVAGAYYYLASAGLDAAQSMAALPQVVKFATAGQFDLAAATDLSTDAQSALGLTVKDSAQNLANLTRVTDVLVAANTLANASTQQFSEALTNRAGAALRLVGKSIEEGTAVLAAWADQGVKGAEAGTRLDIVLRDLQKSALEGKRSHREYYQAVFDTSGEMRNLSDIVGWLERYLDKMSDSQRRAAVSMLGLQEKSVSATLSLVGMSQKIADYEAKLRLAAGTTDLVAGRQIDNFSDRLKILWGRVEDVAITLGKALMPTIEDLARGFETLLGFFGSAFEAFSKWSDSLRSIVVKVLLFVGALGPMLLIFGKMFTAITSLIAVFRTLFAVIAANPIGLIATVVTGATLAFSGLLEKAEAVKKSYSGLGAVANDQGKKFKWFVNDLKAAEYATRLLTVEINKLYEKMSGFETNEDWEILKDIEYKRRQLQDIDDAIRRTRGELDAMGHSATIASSAFGAVGWAVDSFVSSAESGLVRVREGVVSAAKKISDMAIEVETAKDVFTEYALQIQLTGANMARTVVQAMDSIIGGFTQNLGNVFAQWAVYGQSFSKLWKNLTNSLLSQLISTLIAMAAQWAIHWLLAVAGFKALATAAILESAKRGAAGAAASVAETVPFPASLFAAGGAGLAMFSLISSWAAFAKGGIVTGPTVGLLGEAGTEVVLPLDRLEGMLGGGETRILLELDGLRLGEAVVPRMPGVIKARLGNLI